MSYIKYKVKLTKGQLQKLSKALDNKSPIQIRFSKSAISGNGRDTDLMFTTTQIKQINKAIAMNKGLQVRFSMAQIRAMRKDGGILPIVLAGLAALATGAAGATGAFATDKLLNSLFPSEGKALEQFGQRGESLNLPFDIDFNKNIKAGGRHQCKCEGKALEQFGGKLFPMGVKDTRKRK